jgi:hypothetical protein
MKGVAYPELLKGEQWSVEEDARTPRVEFKGRTMSVPLSSSTSDRFVRLHEMAHVKWTPRNNSPARIAAKIGCPEVFVQCAEDARMAFMLRKSASQSGRYTTQEHLGRKAIYDALNTGGLAKRRVNSFAQSVVAKALAGDPNALSEAACCFLASTGTGDRQKLFDAISDEYYNARLRSIPENVLENIQHVRDTASNVAHDAHSDTIGRFGRYKKRTPSFRETEKCAVKLYELLAKAAPTSWSKKGLTLDENGNLVSTGKLRDSKLNGSAPNAYDKPDCKWGSMSIKKMQLVRPTKGAAAQKRAASLIGVVPRRIDRWATDKRIFDTSRRAMGGCVLLDASGSMDIEHADVAALAAASPNMKVAMYSGYCSRGTLSIIADKGKAASQSTLENQREQAGYSNIIDGPALKWLSKQQGPLLWVSDAEVYGVDDSTSEELRQEVAQICNKAGIIRMPNINDALTAFKMLKKSRGKLTPSIIQFANTVLNK